MDFRVLFYGCDASDRGRDMREWRHLQRSTQRRTNHPCSAVLVCFREMRPWIRRHINAAIAVHCSNVTFHKSEKITGKIRGPNTECVARSFKRLPGTAAFQNKRADCGLSYAAVYAAEAPCNWPCGRENGMLRRRICFRPAGGSEGLKVLLTVRWETIPVHHPLINRTSRRCGNKDVHMVDSPDLYGRVWNQSPLPVGRIRLA